MSDEQGDLLDQMAAAGLVDDGEDQPETTTATEKAVESEQLRSQLEIQPATADGRTWFGAEQLRPYLVRISELKPTEGNPFKGKAHVGRLKGSLQRFGQTRPILIDAADEGRIRAGHHLTIAADEMGWTHVAAIAAEFNSEGEAIAYLMADNRLARVGDEDADQVKQLTMLDLIGEQNLEGTGWDLDAVETLRSEAGATPVIVEQEPWGGEAAETAEEASARAEALAGYEPHKEIPLYMTLPEHEQYAEHVRLLQQAWQLKGQMAVILRALAEAYEREAAPVGGAPDEEAGAAPLTQRPGDGAAPPSEAEQHAIEGTSTPTGPDDDIPL
jgi:ParB-like chromosome segregation protein Spo0J